MYRPQSSGGRDAPLGAFLFLHGGGWSLGTLDSYDAMMRWLCARANVAVMSLAYRLAPEHKYPAQLDDASAALEWLRTRACSFGLNRGGIALGGDSVGGTLAAVVCRQDRGRGQPVLVGQVLLYPLLTLEVDPPFASRALYGGGEYFLSRRGIEVAAERYLSAAADRRSPRISPIQEPNLRGLPPTLVVTAGFDPLKDEGAAYVAKLRAAGVPTDHRCFETTIHGFLSFAGVLAVGRQGLDFVADWLASRLTT
ncbi:MAG: alpha/beta hydrolase [Gammaproteobacteria bacterium]